MKIILISDYNGLGKAGDLIDVKPGFARNMLLPKGLALKASKKNWESLYSGLEIMNEPDKRDEEKKLAFDKTPKVFQLLRKFIVTSTRSGLLVIDQKRAHQRVLYEKFLSSIKTRMYNRNR